MRLRRHQGLALDALGAAWSAGRTRAWVTLPPGAGKTLVGLETVRCRLADEAIGAAVVLGPNTAIQRQWLDQASGAGLACGTDRELTAQLTVLTYQSLAVFDADAEVDDDAEEHSLLARLHTNGQRLVQALRDAGPLLLVLDECHHLLEVWGRLLGEVLDQLPDAQVLGLTATPPTAMTPEQHQLVQELFGGVVFETSIPAVVREGDLAPFAELAWLTTPTATEAEWLSGQAARFHDLVHQLTDPEFGSVPFLQWLDARFLSDGVAWSTLNRQEPGLCAAALRMHHAGLVALPEGARLAEEHRHDPTADDWVLLVSDWLTRHLSRTEDPADQAVFEAVRRALPAVGYQWTRRGVRIGRSPVDRVLARSESKTGAAVDIVAIEHLNLGDRLRMLVLCDHERASAMVPIDLRGVLDAQSGSARAVLTALVADPRTGPPLAPLLVTGETVAGAPDTIRDLRAWVATTDPSLAATLVEEPLSTQVVRLAGGWTSRDWVSQVTGFFQEGHCRVLVGTRGLLGEGWDARRISGLVDLTNVTTTTAVVQTRGRALRTDPDWPDKVAVNWSVVCVSETHPKGGNDWDRLVRKHAGFFGVDDVGEIVDGVAHLDPGFSPYAPPSSAAFDAINVKMAERSGDRAAIRERWAVGSAYGDSVARTVRILPSSSSRLGRHAAAPAVVARSGGLEVRSGSQPGPALVPASATAVGVVSGVLLLATASVPIWVAMLPMLLVFGGLLGQGKVWADQGRLLLAAAAEPPSVNQLAYAVADGLLAAGLTSAGAEAVQVDIEPTGEYRCVLAGVGEAESNLFAASLDEVVSPLSRPRYVVPRWVVASHRPSHLAGLLATFGRVRPDGETWHAVPSVLGVNAARAGAYARAWDHWVGGGRPLYTGSPEGAGVLAAQQGEDPLAVTTVMRRHWT